MISDLRLCDNCGMSLDGCVLKGALTLNVVSAFAVIGVMRPGTPLACCTHCKHPEHKQAEEVDESSPLMRREEMVN